MSGEEFLAEGKKLAWANHGCLEFFSGLVVFPWQEEGTAEAGRPEARRRVILPAGAVPETLQL